MRYILLVTIVFFFSTKSNGQTLDSLRVADEIVTEFGMNMTGLLNQLLPFKQITNKTGPYSASLKFIRDRNAFRMGLGIHILTDDNFGGVSEDIINFNIRLGFERRHIVNTKFMFYQTFDLMLMAGNFNSPINDFSDDENAGGGLGFGLGLEYLIYENLSLSTEGIGFVGVVGGTSSIFNATVIPPIAIFLNYKF
jgi:hypothetical protein